jgi:hypothetical protein
MQNAEFGMRNVNQFLARHSPIIPHSAFGYPVGVPNFPVG